MLVINHTKRIKVIFCAFSFLGVILFSISCNPKPPCIGCGEHPNIDETVKLLNDRLLYTEIIKNKKPSLCGDNKDVYEIALRPDILKTTYYFNVYQYLIETGGDVNLIPTANICELIDSVRINKNKKIIDLIKEIGIKSNFRLGFAEVELSNLQYIIAEIYAIIATISHDTEIEIYLKGYADGYTSEWQKPFDKTRAKYCYQSIDYQPTTDIGSINPVNYDRRSKTRKLDKDFYYNKDLPLMRAKFIKDDFIEPFAEKCAKNVKGIYILEGYEFSKDTINPYKRKVQVFFREVCTK